MVHAAPFRFVISKHGVVGMAGEASMIARDKIVLEVRGGKEALIIHIEALAKIRHNVAGKTELRRCGSLDMFMKGRPNRKHRKDAERHESKNLAAAHGREFRMQSGE